MYRRIALAVALAIGLPVAVAGLSAAPASAHELKKVGSYEMLVGFGDEPAYLGEKNFVQMFLHDANGQPVADIGTSLKVSVEAGGKAMALPLEPSFDPDSGLGTKGEFDAFFIPTAVGKYTFHFTGSIKGQKLDVSFTSGPTSFSEVEDPSTVEFPAKVPTLGQVSDRLTAEIPRLNARIAAAQSSADDRASSARTVGIVGVIVGALGLITAVVALTRKRA
jgi:hypothetical protein